MLRVAVTGGIACGKSLVGSCLGRQGFAVCEADELAHRAMAPGRPAFDKVVGLFGPGILGPDGRIDRGALGRLVFGRREKLAALNAAVHPHVIAAWRRWLEEQPGNTAAAAIVAPLLYEAGQGGGWDGVICVASPRREQLRRLKERGLSAAEALLRIEAQMPLDRKVGLADYVVVNTGAQEALEDQVRRVADSILKR
jgi:dephospho-CoA kinase